MNGLDIVGSQAYSFGKGYILDIFKVKPPKDTIFEKEKWKKAENDLFCALDLGYELSDQRFNNSANHSPSQTCPGGLHMPLPHCDKVWSLGRASPL